MRILLINQFFHPDSAATSQLLTDLARELAHQGHQVSVICGSSQYATSSDSIVPAVSVHRIHPLRFGRSRWTRLTSYATFVAGAAVRSIHGPTPDVVLTLTTPPLLSVVGTLLKLLRGTRHIIWEMDLYPDIAIQLGILHPNSLVTRLVRFLAQYSRSKADSVIALGDDMRDSLIGHGIPEGKIHVAHNWADGVSIQPLPFPPLPLTIHYSGNMGLAHDTETIRNAILALASGPPCRFLFSGDGPQRARFEHFCRSNALQNVEFRPYCSRPNLREALAEGHIGLVTQKSGTVGSIVPSKIYGLMAAGRPILYIGPGNATPARLINRFECGWHILPGDVSSLVSLLTRLSASPGEISILADRARHAFSENFDLPLGTARIAAILTERFETRSEIADTDLVSETRPVARTASAS